MPKQWERKILIPYLEEIKRLCTLKTASFSRILPKNEVPYPTCEKEVDAFVKDRIQVWLTNITAAVECIEETLPGAKFDEYE